MSKSTRRLALMLFALAFAALACNLPTPGGEATSTPGADPTATDFLPTDAPPTDEAPTDVPAPTDEPTATSNPLGYIEGQMCYPSEFIPAMNAYFEEVNSNTVYNLPIAENQQNFSIEVPPGQYIAYAWLPDFSYGGSYSQAVPCGLTVACNDHSPIIFDVTAGNVMAKVNICDWYAPQDQVPLPND